MIDTAWFDEAVAFAVASHRGQPRKGSETPYVVHPLRVALLLERHGFPRAVVIAGLLHDVVEDCAVPGAELARRFGDEVAHLVDCVSERWAPAGAPRRPWRERKEEAIARLAAAPPAAVALKAADGLDNLCSMLADHAALGAAVWDRFTATPDDHAWYYGAIAEAAAGALGDHPLVADLRAALAELQALLC